MKRAKDRWKEKGKKNDRKSTHKINDIKEFPRTNAGT
jgi:hypothetical protein